MKTTYIDPKNMAVNYINKLLYQKRIAHAYCFYGPQGSGKYEMALYLAKALNCNNTENHSACNKCNNCTLINIGEFPYVSIIEGKSLSIKIDQVRELKAESRYKTSNGVTRVFIIKQADNITLQGANSLLKLLEESPFNFLIILLTQNYRYLLPTISSRCHNLRFNQNTENQQLESLNEINKEEALFLTHLSKEGNDFFLEVGKNQFFDCCQKIIMLCRSLIYDSPDYILILSSNLIQDLIISKNIIILIDFLALWWRDLIYQRFSLDTLSIFPSDYASECRSQATCLSRQQLLQGLQIIINFRNRVKGSVQSPLLLEHMMLTIQEAFKNA